MKECPKCGRKFNWWERMVGESKTHINNCSIPEKKRDGSYLAAMCRGCPAGCYDKVEYSEKE